MREDEKNSLDIVGEIILTFLINIQKVFRKEEHID